MGRGDVESGGLYLVMAVLVFVLSALTGIRLFLISR